MYNLFPQSNEKGVVIKGLNTKLIHQTARQSTPINQKQLDKIIEKHFEFLNSGGAGGQWKVLLINGIVTGIYENGVSEKGGQANFERCNLGGNLVLQNALLPFANFCGIYAEGVNFSNTNLSYSLMTDAMFNSCLFENANLKYTDFSRANLQSVSFVNANLQGCDFENCNLSQADFSGAKLIGTRFPGANLEGIKY